MPRIKLACKNKTSLGHIYVFHFKHLEAVVQRCSVKKVNFRNSTKFTGKHLRDRLFFNKAAGLWYRCFPVNYVKFLRTPFLQNTSGRLILFRTICRHPTMDVLKVVLGHTFSDIDIKHTIKVFLFPGIQRSFSY